MKSIIVVSGFDDVVLKVISSNGFVSCVKSGEQIQTAKEHLLNQGWNHTGSYKSDVRMDHFNKVKRGGG